MTDIVRLGLSVNSQGFVTAKRDMDGFRSSAAAVVKEASAAEKAVGNTSSTTSVFGETVVNASRKIDGMGRAMSSAGSATEAFDKSVGNTGSTTSDFGKEAAKATKETDDMGKTMSSTNNIAAAFGKTLGLIGATLLTTGFVKYADAWSDLNSRLINATGGAEDARIALEAISETARRTYSSLEATAQGFLQNNLVLKELGYTTRQQLDMMSALNNSLVISGAKAQNAELVMGAFGRAMAQGKLAGQELNLIMNYSSRTVEALAEGLGVTTIELREMTAAGQVTADKMFGALISQMQKLEDESGEMPATIGDGFLLIRNAVLETIGVFDQQNQISVGLAESLVWVADNLRDMVSVLGAAAAGFVTYQLAVNGTSLALTAATAAQRLFNTAALANPYAALAAAIVGATAGLYMYMTRAREAAAPTIDLAGDIEQLAEKFRELGNAQRELAIIETAAALENATQRLSRAQAALAASMVDQDLVHTYRASEEQIRALRVEVELAEKEFSRLSGAAKTFSGIDLDLKTKEFLEYNGWVEQATESQYSYADALQHVNSILPLVLSNYEKIYRAQSQAAYLDIAQAIAEERAALHMTNKEQDIYNFLKSEAAQTMLPEHTRAIIDQISALHDERQALADLADTSDETSERIVRGATAVETGWNRSIERMRDVIGDFFQGIIVDGNLSFRSLLDSFKRLIAEMIATAAANKVIIGLGLGGASGSALASGAGSALSGGAGLASVGGVLTSIEGMFAKSGFQAGADFMYGLQTQLANTGSLVGGGMGAGLALSAGAGILGGMAGTALGESLFGKQAESAWGAALGGIAGSVLGGPIGAAIGGAIGGALDAAFGGDGKKRVTLGVETDPTLRAGDRGMTGTQIRGASGLLYTGRATRADGSAADELVMMFAQIDDALTMFTESVTGTAVRLSGALKGSSSQAGLSTQDSGINSFFGAADFNSLNQKQLIDATGKFIDAWLEAAQKALGSEFNVGSLVRQYSGDINAMLAFIDSFGQLMSAQSIDPVRAAVDAQVAANRTLVENYEGITAAVHGMSSAYDGSLGSTQALTAALNMQQQMAYQLASAYLQVQTQVDSLFGNLSENIRMSLMSEQELYDYQRAQIEALAASINMMTDPEMIMGTAERIEAQLSQVWGRLDEEQRQVMGPEFLQFIDQTNAIAQDKLRQGLEAVEVTQEDINRTIQQGIQNAANTMQLASTTFLQGANMLVSYAESVTSMGNSQREVNG